MVGPSSKVEVTGNRIACVAGELPENIQRWSATPASYAFTLSSDARCEGVHDLRIG